jgi:uncharacterized protein YvpB
MKNLLYKKILFKKILFKKNLFKKIFLNILILISSAADSHIIFNVPLLTQTPELARGCETASLCMLLNYYGVKVTKLELAQKINKEPPITGYANGSEICGNPNKGFVGDMYELKNFGYGVYAAPVLALANNYIAAEALRDFSEIISRVKKNHPVWAIVNAEYKKLSEYDFYEWQTNEGKIKITYKEHSVLITGFDKDYIYFNDPLGLNNKSPRKDFIDAWEQMGRQAVSKKI